MRRFASIAFAAAVAAAAGLAVRWLLERDAGERPGLPSPQRADKSGAAQNGSTPASRTSKGPMRDQLYTEARRLEIEGRSKMNKSELQEAVKAAKTGGAA